MKDLILDRWKSFSDRDQKSLLILSAIASILIFYGLLWLPIQNGREKLAIAIPEKQARLLIMQQQASEIEVNRKKRLLITSSESLKSATDGSAKAHGIELVSSPLQAKHIEIVIKSVGFNAWIQWIKDLQSENGMRLITCNIVPTGIGNNVSINATLAIE